MGGRWEITKNVLSRAIKGDPDGQTLYERLTEKPKERIDTGFPLNLRILARVNLDDTQFLLAEKKLVMSRRPPCTKGTIVEIGVVKATPDDDCVDYLARISPDNPSEGGYMTLLYVETQKGEVLSTKLCTPGDVINPETRERWDIYRNLETGILTEKEVYAPGTDIIFGRYWGDPDIERVKPLILNETVYGDRYGDTTKTNRLIEMMFARGVVDDQGQRLTDEYLLLSVVNDECVEPLYGVPITVTSDQIMG